MSQDPGFELPDDLERIAASIPQESGGFAELRRLLGILPNPLGPHIPGSQAQQLEDPAGGQGGFASPVSNTLSGEDPGTQPGWDQSIASQGVADAFNATGIGPKGFGSSVTRYLSSGFYNGDFYLPPRDPAAGISAANPLPFWSFVVASGAAMSCHSVVDAASGSGRVVTIEMSGINGAAGDHAYLEQIVPINASRSQAFSYRARAAMKTDATTSSALLYVETQYLKNDGVTPTGVAGSLQLPTSFYGPGVIVDIQAGANSTAQVPADAYFMRLRIGFRRDVAPVTTFETLTLLEVHEIVGSSEVMVTDIGTPANSPIRGIYLDGHFYLGHIDNLDTISSPLMEMDTTSFPGRTTFYGSIVPGSVDDTVTGAIDTDIAATVALYGLKMGDGVRSKPITPIGWQLVAYPNKFVASDVFTVAQALPVVAAGLGGAIEIPFVLYAPMQIASYQLICLDTVATQRTCEMRLYASRKNNTALGNFITGTDATISFLPAGASTVQAAAVSVPGTVIPPGQYTLVIRNTSAAVVFSIGTSAGTALSFGKAGYRTHAGLAALGATLDMLTGFTGTSKFAAVCIFGRDYDGVTNWT